MNEPDLIATLDALAAESYGFGQGELQQARAEALRRYLCEPLGDEQEARSQVVSTDLRDTVEWIVPQWLKVCLSGKEIVKFEPVGPEDEAQAELESNFVNWTILQRNDALTFLSTWARDALISKNGYAKAYWHEASDIKTESYKALTDDALAMLQNDPEVQVIELSTYQAPVGPMLVNLHDVRVRRTYACGYVRLENVPPEEISVHKSVKGLDLQSAIYIRHRTQKTLSELRQDGYDVADDVTDGDGLVDTDIVDARDRWDEDEDAPTGVKATRAVWLTEEHVRLDFDGDGIAELRRIVRIGSQILANEETDLVPFAAITPLTFPHRHVGLGYDDLVEQHAAVKTALMRQALDNLYLSNNARIAADFDRVNIDDLLTSRPGGIVRTRGAPGDVLMPLTTPQTFQNALQGIQWVDAWRENSTGVSAYYQGMNADALNKTATGINQIMSASQQRVEAVIRSFANGFRDLCYIVHALTLKNASASEKIKLNNRWVTVDPREWVKRTNLSVTVGLGTGSKDIRVQQLTMLWGMQMQGAGAGIAQPKNLYETGKKIVEELGYANADQFWTDPSQMPPRQTPPPPEVIQAQTAMQIKQMELQADAQKFQAETALELQKLQAEQQLELQKVQAQSEAKFRELQAQLGLQSTNDQRDAEREALKAQLDAQLKAQEAEFDRWKAELDARTKLMVAKINQGDQSIEDINPPALSMQEALMQALQGFTAAVAELRRPKTIIRDQTGRAQGIA